MSRGLVARRVREGRESAYLIGDPGLKQELLVHSEQIVKGEGGHWIFPLCTIS